MISYEIFAVNLKGMKRLEMVLLNINFNKTGIFKTHFFDLLSELSVRQLRLSFAEYNLTYF